MVTRAIGTAQKRVETRNFEIRKHLLEYDDVMNKQREIVYGMRREILEGESQEETVLEWMGEVAAALVSRYAPEDAHAEEWDMAALNEASLPPVRLPHARRSRGGAEIGVARGAGDPVTRARPRSATASARAQLGPEMFHRLERWIMLGLRWEDGEFRGHRPAVEGPSSEHGPPEGGHRPPRLRPARSADRVQEGSLRHVPGDGGPPQGDRAGAALQGAHGAEEAAPIRVAAARAPALAGAARRGGGHRARAPRGRRGAPAARGPRRRTRSDATTRARAAPGRSTRSATR